MSGFVVLADRTQSSIRREQLQAMHDAIAHRGPDGGDTWCDDEVGFGHQHLGIAPESRFEAQPYREDGLTVTGDVRIDNRRELLSSLPVSSRPAETPDSRLVVAAYRKWGAACVEHLHGAFAFALRDEHRSRLMLGRDRFGVKPLYYVLTSEVFAAGSEKKALLPLPVVSGTVDETKIGDFLIAMYEDTERTFFESIRRLPPAHTIVVDDGESQTRRYWDLDPTQTITLDSDAAYERRFRELFEQAVRDRLRTTTPVGTSLSGGMDSSSVTAVARDLLPDDDPLHTFSNVYDDAPSSDEREFIEPVIDQSGINSHYVFPEDVGALVDESDLRTYLDQPPHNTMHFATWERTKCAATHDVGVILGGELGDSAIGYGLGLLPELFWTGRWRHLNRELRAMAEVADAPAVHLFKRHVLSAFVPDVATRWRQKLRDEYNPLADENPIIDQEFIERASLLSRYRTHRLRGSWVTPRARRLQYRSLLTGRNATNFEVLDLIHAAFGIEPRYPFADARLVEFSLAIPATQQFADGWTRSIVRRALGDLLPKKVQWRPWKTSVNEAFWNALAAEGKRLDELVEVPEPLSRYLDADALRNAREGFAEEPNSHDGRALWKALSLSVWLDEYVVNAD